VSFTLPGWAAALPAPAYYATSVLVLIWDTFMAGQIAQLRTAPRPFAFMSALAALLLAPALLVDAAAASSLAGNAFDALGWIWPAITILFTAQAIYAVGRRMLSPFLGIPIVLYDVLLTAIVLTRYRIALGATPAVPWLALATAHINVVGYLTGPGALGARFIPQLPLLAPAFPARWRVSTSLRAILALLALVWCVATLLEIPAAAASVASYEALGTEPLQERPAGDFTIGLRVLPIIDGPPTASALRNDLALVDTTSAGAVSVVVDPRAGSPALDSLARALDALRRDTTVLLVTLAYEPGAGAMRRRAPAAFAAARLAAVSRIVRHLHPDYLLPADAPYGTAARALGVLPLEYWTRYLTDATAAAHRIDGKVRIGVAVSAFDARDSALFAWASAPAAPIDAIGFALAPDFTGGAGLAARLRAADRWLAAAPRPTREAWVFDARGFPTVHGEASQERAIWATLAWATGHAAVKGMIVGDAGDYEARTGLRAPAGRLRPVVAALRQATQSLRETETAPEQPRVDQP
jgi:hypothetical protein